MRATPALLTPLIGAGLLALPAPPPAPVAPDAPLAPWRAALLELAFDAASAIPMEPHLKDRSRAQEEVLAACLELDELEQARGWVQGIDNWRRGTAYAALAFAAARRGDADQAQQCLERARLVAQGESEWRRDRIMVAIAATRAWLGEADEAARLEQDVTESEIGKVEAARAMRADASTFDRQVETLDALLSSAAFDLMRNAMVALKELFARFYDDSPRRALVEQRLARSWDRLPPRVALGLMMEVAGVALDHGDRGKALELVGGAQAILEDRAWLPEDEVALRGRLAALRFRAGDEESARAGAAAALALFEAARPRIMSIHRAAALRPLAEAYQAMGDRTAALSVARRAVEEGTATGNSRPRAEDLCATCCSMAVHGIEPDDALWSRLREIREGLGNPW